VDLADVPAQVAVILSADVALGQFAIVRQNAEAAEDLPFPDAILVHLILLC
jgi:hypothetical protein